MHTKIIFITLAVDDLDRSVAFYRDGLGWHTEGIVAKDLHDEVTDAHGTIAFFALDSGLMIGLYERTNLAKDAGMPAGPRSSTEFSLGIPAESQAEVDTLLAEAEAAGGTLPAPAHMRPWGIYSGYFADPDGHLWEIVWNSNAWTSLVEPTRVVHKPNPKRTLPISTSVDQRPGISLTCDISHRWYGKNPSEGGLSIT